MSKGDTTALAITLEDASINAIKLIISLLDVCSYFFHNC